ncbi:chymotrypsin B [Nephila pilipes]|uniref:Chymotrypsin B n=1 Tax=Nephila pilipes TaxID=299642 RepID=A0A8X6NA92_NEPPI|nr:chymotrypsin B [Nephila pilipes]
MIFNVGLLVSLCLWIENIVADNSTSIPEKGHLFQCDCGKVNEMNARIIGGSEVNPPHKYPWMVTIGNSRVDFQCGGALITLQYVLTSVRCVEYDEVVIVGIGVRNLSESYEQILSQTIKKHPLYEKDPIKHDIALIMLQRPVNLYLDVSTICLPHNYDLEKPGIDAVVAGWGYYSNEYDRSPVLKETVMKIFPGTEQIVAKGENSSETSDGDTGSPLFVEYKEELRQHVIGVLSKEERGMTYFARVSSSLTWILQNIQDGAMCQ